MEERPDRYISFRDIDCDGNAERFVTALGTAMRAGERDDPFWSYFEAKLEGRNGPKHDALYHIHCHLNHCASCSSAGMRLSWRRCSRRLRSSAVHDACSIFAPQTFSPNVDSRYRHAVGPSLGDTRPYRRRG